MSNYYGVGRTNYVKFTDMETVRRLCDHLGMEIVQKDDNTVCILAADDDGSFPTLFSDEPELAEFIPDGMVDPTFGEVICRLLDPRYILILKQIGHEKHRYLSGMVEALDHTGQSVSISLLDIDMLIIDRWGSEGKVVTDVSY